MGISFGEDDIEVIEWNFNNIDKSRIRTSKEEVLEQVLSGLESVNQSLGTNYKLSKIYFSPFDISTNRIYSGLIALQPWLDIITVEMSSKKSKYRISKMVFGESAKNKITFPKPIILPI